MVLTPLRSMMGIAFERSLWFSLWLLGFFFRTPGPTIQFFMFVWKRLFSTCIRVLHFTSFLRPLGKCLMGKKTETTLMLILRAPVRITLLQQGAKLGRQGTAKGMKMENV